MASNDSYVVQVRNRYFAHQAGTPVKNDRGQCTRTLIKIDQLTLDVRGEKAFQRWDGQGSMRSLAIGKVGLTWQPLLIRRDVRIVTS